jgi:hypothetical protein
MTTLDPNSPHFARELSEAGHRYGQANAAHALIVYAAEIYFEALGTEPMRKADLIKSLDAAERAAKRKAVEEDR